MAAEKQTCMIIGASPISSARVFREYDPREHFVICADAGYETALQYGITPDLVVGDFDSARRKPPAGVKTLTLPVEKDVTDTMFAAKKGLDHGFRDFVLLGCLGGRRFDHTLANLDVLEYLLFHSAKAVLADETTKVFLLRDSRLRMTDCVGTTVSVFPYNGSSCTVSYIGLQYPLDHETLTCGGPVMGVSNCVTADPAEVRVYQGTALVVVYREA